MSATAPVGAVYKLKNGLIIKIINQEDMLPKWRNSMGGKIANHPNDRQMDPNRQINISPKNEDPVMVKADYKICVEGYFSFDTEFGDLAECFAMSASTLKAQALKKLKASEYKGRLDWEEHQAIIEEMNFRTENAQRKKAGLPPLKKAGKKKPVIELELKPKKKKPKIEL